MVRSWTHDEDTHLLHLASQYTNRWKIISDLLISDRTANAVKNRYSLLTKKHAKMQIEFVKAVIAKETDTYDTYVTCTVASDEE